MKINVELSDGAVSAAIEKALETYLSSERGQKYLVAAIDKKVNSHLTERKITDYTQQRIARIITQDSLAGLSEAYGINDYENRMVQVFTSMISNSAEFKNKIKDMVKSTIKIG